MAGPKRQKASTPKGAAMLLYGIPGVGKTRLIGGGEDTLIVRPPEDHTVSIEDQDAIDEAVVTGWDEMQSTFQWLHREGHEQYQWVWLDSITLFQDVGLYDLFEKAVDRNPNRAEFGLDKPEYGVNQFRLNTWIRNMVGLVDEDKINFGIVAHTMEWWNPREEKMLWAPSIQGREGIFMQKVCGMMNTVAYYYATKRKNGNVARVLRTEDDGQNILVKDQLELFDEGRLVNPTMAEITQAINKNTRPVRRGRRKKTRG